MSPTSYRTAPPRVTRRNLNGSTGSRYPELGRMAEISRITTASPSFRSDSIRRRAMNMAGTTLAEGGARHVVALLDVENAVSESLEVADHGLRVFDLLLHGGPVHFDVQLGPVLDEDALHALQRRKFHAFDVDLDEVWNRQIALRDVV